MSEIKRNPEDFIVEEIGTDGTVFEIRKKWEFEGREGDQLICVLEKRDWDTQLAIKEIGKRLHISRKRIGFAGTKDKKAVTSQRISIWKVKKEDAERLKIKDIKLFPLHYSNERIRLGDLWGNRFTVKVYTDKEPKKLDRILNFFGAQRFGETRPITHLVGEAIIKGDFEKAVKIYLTKTFPGESANAKEARKKLSEGRNYHDALRFFPKYLKFERTLLAYLADNPNDYVGALRKLPKFLKLMFIHAYQAALFNDFLTEMINRKLKYETGPLYGYELKLESDLEKEILEKKGLKVDDFRISSMPEMSCKGGRRKTFVELKDFKVLEKGKGFCVVRFSLPKGSYATEAIKQMFE